MRTPRPKVLVPVAALVVVMAATAGVAFATTGSGITTTNLSLGLFDEVDVKSHLGGHRIELRTKGETDLHVVSNVIAPGGHTGWHTHPGPSLITVKSGTITAYEGDDPTCSPIVYTAGQGFVDPGDGHVHILRNESAAPAETIAVQLLSHGAPRRIDMPAPGNCTF